VLFAKNEAVVFPAGMSTKVGSFKSFLSLLVR